MKSALISVFIFLIMLCIILPTALADSSDKVKITGITKVWGDTDKKLSFLEGDLLIAQGETTIRTPYAEIDQDKKEATFSRGVHLVKKDLTIDGDVLTFNFKSKQGTFTGKVCLERAESKDESGKKKDHFKLTCNQLDIDTNKQNFTAKDQAAIEHKEFNGKSQTILYDNDTQILTLSGQAVLNRNSGENLDGDAVKIDLSKKSFEVVGGAEVSFDVNDKNSDSNVKKDEKDGKSDDKGSKEANATKKAEQSKTSKGTGAKGK